MAQLSETQVDLIASQVAGMLRPPTTAKRKGVKSEARATNTPTAVGVFHDVDQAVMAAQKAFDQFKALSIEKRKDIIANIRLRMTDSSEELARRAQAETGLGRVADKIEKNNLVIEKTPGVEALEPSAWSGDRGLTLTEKAPYGVIASITPCTNPTSTIICNTIGMLAAGNAVVFNVHPTAKDVSLYNIELLNQAITEVGGPPNLVCTIAKPTIATAQDLMRHKGVHLLVVTGGAEVVKAAMTSGKRAICAGPGNPPVVVDETADIEQAAQGIVKGASMDNGIICVLEKEVFVVDSVADQLLTAFPRYDAVVLKSFEFFWVEKVIFKEIRGQRKPGVINKALIGKNVQEILAEAGISVPDNIRLAVAEVPARHPLVWTEQMLPILPVVRVPNVNQAIDLAKEAEHGFRHTAVMYSKNLDNLSRMARVMDCSIFVKNGPSLAGLGQGGEGFSSFTIASPTGEGMTNPNSFVRDRRCVLVDHFRIV